MKTLFTLCVGLIALGSAFTPSAWAQCGPSKNSKLVVTFPASAPALAMLKAHARPNPSDDAPKEASIVGLWHILFVSDGQVQDEGFDIWHADGTEVLNDSPPPVIGNVCLGTWVSTDKLAYKLNHVSWVYDDMGNLTGTATIKETVTLDPKGATFTGKYMVDVFDLNGNKVFHQDGDLKAEKITAD